MERFNCGALLPPEAPLQQRLYLPGQQLRFPSSRICISTHAILCVHIQIYAYMHFYINVYFCKQHGTRQRWKTFIFLKEKNLLLRFFTPSPKYHHHIKANKPFCAAQTFSLHVLSYIFILQ